MQYLSKLFQVLAEFISKNFPKYLFESALRKEQWATPFVEHLVHNFLSEKIGMFRHFVRSIDERYQWDFSQSSCSKALSKRSNEQHFSRSTLYLTFYRQKCSKNAIFRHFARSIDESDQWNFPKVVVLKRSTKPTKSNSFRRVPFA